MRVTSQSRGRKTTTGKEEMEEGGVMGATRTGKGGWLIHFHRISDSRTRLSMSGVSNLKESREEIHAASESSQIWKSIKRGKKVSII